MGPGAFYSPYMQPTQRPQEGAQQLSGLINPLLPIGLGFAGGLASYFGGAGDRKRFDRAYGALGNAPQANFAGKTLGQFDAWSQPRLRQQGRQIDRRFGLDTGTGAGELFNSQRQQYGQLAAQLIPQEAQFNANQQMQARLAQLQAALGRL